MRWAIALDMGASTVGEAFSEGVEETLHPQPRNQSSRRLGAAQFLQARDRPRQSRMPFHLFWLRGEIADRGDHDQRVSQNALVRQHPAKEVMANPPLRGGGSACLQRWLGGKTPDEVDLATEPCPSRSELTMSGARTVQ